MSDLISRQAAIDALSAPHGILYPIRTIESLPSAQPELIEQEAYVRGFEQGRTQGMIDAQTEQRWIPCSEKLPENEDIYLVTFDKSNLLDNETQVSDAFWINNQWQYGVLESYERRMPKLVVEPIEELKVIAWMPLPEPRKEKQNEIH